MGVYIRDVPLVMICIHSACTIKWVYPQCDGSLAIVDFDASKGFIDPWVHFFVAIVDIHWNGYRWKRCFFSFY